MRMFELKRIWHSGPRLCGARRVALLLMIILGSTLQFAHAQTPSQESLTQKIQQLTDAMAKTQAQLEQSQHDLDEMRQQLSELQRQMAQGGAAATASDPAMNPQESTSQSASESTSAEIQDLRERQALLESQIATQEQSKVESQSKYPVKITGMLLMNGFVNTGGVDLAATPSVAIGGSGNAGASVRQTVLGFDARGPRLFGARSFADLRVDFYGSQAVSATTTSYSGYYNTNSALLRLRTAHAGLAWDKTQVYFALDRPIINPDTPTSLTAVAVPALAWSGNLWTWNPQAVITQDIPTTGRVGMQLQAALIDPGDAPLTPPVLPTTTPAYAPPNSAEQSSKPGVEARMALVGSDRDDGRSHLGAGGYFATHESSLGRSFDSWAATLDARLPLVAHLELSGNFYRGAGLGGLGGGGYKDFAYSQNPNTGGYFFRPLDDVGGWAQLKEKASERLEFNAAYGMDNVFAHPLRLYYVEGASAIANLARNRTYTGNVIYSPSAYLMFSFEYRYLQSTEVEGPPAASNIFGVGAGYKF
jgi:hypothetical protein